MLLCFFWPRNGCAKTSWATLMKSHEFCHGYPWIQQRSPRPNGQVAWLLWRSCFCCVRCSGRRHFSLDVPRIPKIPRVPCWVKPWWKCWLSRFFLQLYDMGTMKWNILITIYIYICLLTSQNKSPMYCFMFQHCIGLLIVQRKSQLLDRHICLREVPVSQAPAPMQQQVNTWIGEGPALADGWGCQKMGYIPE